jgi:hypothetical protein
MAHEIDASDGSIVLDSGMMLKSGTDINLFRAMAIPVHRDLDMKTGWRYLSIGPYALLGKAAFFSLGFFEGFLKCVHFSFDEATSFSPELVRESHDQALFNEFGPATTKDQYKTMYAFSWGTVVSAYDPRINQSDVVVAWQ